MPGNEARRSRCQPGCCAGTPAISAEQRCLLGVMGRGICRRWARQTTVTRRAGFVSAEALQRCNPVSPPGSVGMGCHRRSDSPASDPGIDRTVGDALTDTAELKEVKTCWYNRFFRDRRKQRFSPGSPTFKDFPGAKIHWVFRRSVGENADEGWMKDEAWASDWPEKKWEAIGRAGDHINERPISLSAGNNPHSVLSPNRVIIIPRISPRRSATVGELGTG